MFTLRKLSITLAGATLITLGTVAPAESASFYSLTELPFKPSDINNVSQVVGEQYLWNNGTLTDLRTLPGAGTSSIFANAINDNGLIVGRRLVNSSDSWQPFINRAFKSDGTTITDLGVADFCRDRNYCPGSSAIDINNVGQVLLINDGPVSYLRDPDGTSTQVLVFGVTSAINNVGQIVAYYPTRGRGPGVGFLFDNGTSNPLYAPAGPSSFPPDTEAAALNINDLGQVVGTGSINPRVPFSFQLHATLWSNPKNNSIGTDLGTLGGRTSQANAINNLGQVVGVSDTAGSTQHAFLWEDNKLFDLNNLITPDLGWELTSASQINNKGQIVGTGSLNGQERSFLLTPVPEPNFALSLVGCGVFGLGSWLKRKQQEKKSASNGSNA